MRRSLRLAARLVALAPAFVLGLPAQALAARLHPPLTRTLPVLFHRYILRVLGLRCTVRGERPAGPVLLVANHISWLDIPVLASVMPLSFVAKSEVAGWPGFGALARLQRTVFVDRQRRQATGAAAQSIAGRLAEGDAMVLFAEGTTSDGHRVLPYRSALLGAAQDASARVVPLAIRYSRRHGIALTRREMPEIAWYGDMDLVPHLAALLKSGPIDVTLTFGPAMDLTGPADRKSLVRAAETWARKARHGQRFEESVKPS